MADRYRAGKRLWSPEDEAILTERYPHESTEAIAKALRRSLSSVYARAGKLGLEKTPAYLASLAHASRLPVFGAKYRFAKGQVPLNKGLRRPGYSCGRGRMQETQFKSGVLQGRAADVVQPIGAERFSKEGYLQRKINNDLPFQRRWRAVHIIVWEEANGPLPAGHAIRFKNGDKSDIRLDNLECITRRELMRRNTVHRLPKELVKTIQLIGALKRAINRKEKGNEKQD